MQTTYENFRYRYDKKENPYNRGLLQNLREVFFSQIPPSSNKFRSIVEDDHMMVAVTPNFEGVRSSKEKIDIEMGSKLMEDEAFPIPEILRGLEFDDDLEDDFKTTIEGERPHVDPLFPLNEEVEKFEKGASDRVPDSQQVLFMGDSDAVAVESSTRTWVDTDGTEDANDSSQSKVSKF